MLELTDNNFKESLEKGKFLFMFYTDWCPLCPPIIAMLNELEQDEGGRFTFAKIDFDKTKIAAEYYGAFAVPLVLAIIDGKALFGTAGLLVKEGYRMIAHELLYDFNEVLLDEKIGRLEDFADNVDIAKEMKKLGI